MADGRKGVLIPETILNPPARTGPGFFLGKASYFGVLGVRGRTETESGYMYTMYRCLLKDSHNGFLIHETIMYLYP